jgi:hypothetical protein
MLDTCLGRTKGKWLKTQNNVNVEEFGASAMLRRSDWPDGLVNAIDLESRVYALWDNGTETFFYRGSAGALNQAIRKYAAIKGGDRHLVLLPGPVHTQTRGGEPVEFDWQVQAPGGLDKPTFGKKHVRMTIFISALKPRAVNRRKVDQWVKELDSDVYRTRETAYEELRKLGNDAKPLLRAARAAKPTLEVRRRIDLLLDRLPRFDLTDLEIPKGIILADASDLIAQGLKDLNHPDRNIRFSAVQELTDLARFSDKVVPALVEVFAKDKDVHIRQVAAACLADIGLPAKSASAALKPGLREADANIRHTCQVALARLAETEETPAQQERMRREQVVAREIQEWKNAKAAGRK